MEYRVFIGGTEYGMKDIESAVIESPLFDKLSAGNACSAQFEISFWPLGTVPRMAEIIPQARNSADEDWGTLGTFYTDERSTSVGGKMSIIAYDSMLKSEVVWTPENEQDFPMAMSDAVTKIAELMGVGVDARTAIETGDYYKIDYPANDYTLRDVLRFIASAHMGNWIITENNELLLVPLFSSMPEPTNYLVDENGNAITFGGVRITV